MTTRLKGLVVTFDRDIREDDAENWIKAILMLRGVISVKPVESGLDDHMNRERIRFELQGKLYDALKEEK